MYLATYRHSGTTSSPFSHAYVTRAQRVPRDPVALQRLRHFGVHVGDRRPASAVRENADGVPDCTSNRLRLSLFSIPGVSFAASIVFGSPFRPAFCVARYTRPRQTPTASNCIGTSTRITSLGADAVMRSDRWSVTFAAAPVVTC